MARLENGIITFTEEEVGEVRKIFCPSCFFGFNCSGPDSKTNRAEIEDPPADAQIVAEAACSPKIKVQTKV